MIALWMAYSLVAGMLIVAGCHLLEELGRSVTLPTRWVWAAGMVLMLALTAAALRSARAPAPSPRSPGPLHGRHSPGIPLYTFDGPFDLPTDLFGCRRIWNRRQVQGIRIDWMSHGCQCDDVVIENDRESSTQVA